MNTFPYFHKALIHPLIEYGNVIWGSFYVDDQQKNKILKFQCKATRLVYSINHLSYVSHLAELKLPSLSKVIDNIW